MPSVMMERFVRLLRNSSVGGLPLFDNEAFRSAVAARLEELEPRIDVRLETLDSVLVELGYTVVYGEHHKQEARFEFLNIVGGEGPRPARCRSLFLWYL